MLLPHASLTIYQAESLIDKAIETKYIGGVYGNQRPTEFLCLILKLLQIQPEKEILVEYLRADEFKYAKVMRSHPYQLIYIYQVSPSSRGILYSNDVPCCGCV